MRVGVNYPWFDYGWDFGVAPPHWRPASDPRWTSELDADLRHIQTLGITLVRWFILADGLTYGSGAWAPRRDVARDGEWRFEPPPLDREFANHFDELLRRFAIANTVAPIQLLPVLIDFHFCDAGLEPVTRVDPDGFEPSVPDSAWVKRGRVDAIADPTRRSRFLDEVLVPLLEVSRPHRELIYAWELMNEPEWVTNGWHPDRRRDHPVDDHQMSAFLEDGCARVRAAGFLPTVGFASIHTLRRAGITAEINQFHHYAGGVRRLQPHRFEHGFPTILGEFATAPADVWPDLPAGAQTTFDRLALARARGYELALPWSFRAIDRHTRWSDDDIVRFTTPDDGGAER